MFNWKHPEATYVSLILPSRKATSGQNIPDIFLFLVSFSRYLLPLYRFPPSSFSPVSFFRGLFFPPGSSNHTTTKAIFSDLNTFAVEWFKKNLFSVIFASWIPDSFPCHAPPYQQTRTFRHRFCHVPPSQPTLTFQPRFRTIDRIHWRASCQPDITCKKRILPKN